MRRLHPSPLLALAAILLAGLWSTAAAQEPTAPKAAEPIAAPVSEVAKAAADAAAAADDAKARGDTAWMLTSSAFVMLMVPGLALFYGGMVRRKNVLATMMQSMAALAVVGVYWIAFGYGLAFGPSKIKFSLFGVTDGGLVGWDWKLFFLQGIGTGDKLPGYNITVYTHCMFQGMFAIITPALISGALAERIRFWPFCIYMLLWVTVVYCPLAHMVWAFDWFYDVPTGDAVDGKLPALGATAIGLLGKMGALDFAGGTVVHIAAGLAGFAGCLALRRRHGYPEHPIHPNSMVLTLVGAGLLWFGWFGFNGGSATNSTGLSASAFSATQAAAAAAGLSWVFVEWLFKGKPTALGLASGIVAGLVAVTPASGFVYIWGGLAIGAIAGVVCYFCVCMKSLLGYDDSLDAFGVHGVGGFLGAVLTGFFCYSAVNLPNTDGYFAMKSAMGAPAALEAELAEVKADAPKLRAEAEKLDKEYKEFAAKAGDDKDKKDKVTALQTEALVAAAKADAAEARIKAIGTKDDKDTELAKATATADGYKEAGRTPWSQPIIQLKAAGFSVAYAFVLSLALALLVQALTLGNFTTTAKDESDGLDITEHGEAGFDFGLGDTAGATLEPRAAKAPPGGTKRFDVVVDGVENGGLMRVWNELCQPREGPTDPEFRAVYPYVTTVRGNRFRFRGGDPTVLSGYLQKLFQKRMAGTPIKVRVES